MLNDLPTVRLHIATLAQTDFTYPFRPFELDYAKVKVDDVAFVRTAPGGGPGTYAVLDDKETEGGTIRLGAGATAGARVLIERDMKLERVSNFPQQGPVPNSTFDRQFDYQLGLIQDLNRSISDFLDRGILVPIGEVGGVLPAAADRANKFLTFAPDGSPLMSFGTGADLGLRQDLAAVTGAELVRTADGSLLQDIVQVAATTQALLASTKSLVVGSTVRTADGCVYRVAPVIAADHHLTTAGGHKLYVIPQGNGARQWGVRPNMGVDVYVLLQQALNNMLTLELEVGVYLTSRGLRQTLDRSIFRGAGVDKTIVRVMSPLNDGAADGIDGNEAGVWAMGAEGAPVFGLRTEDMTIDCQGLMTGLPSGDVYMKGHHFRRVHGFEVNRVKVIECGSYSFWANDKTIEAGGTITGCSGVYNDCTAVDGDIFFETTGRCYITYNRPRAEQTRSVWTWPVSQTFHFYGGDGLITVNDYYARVKSSTIIGPLLTMKNVTFNNGYAEQLDPLTTVINMSGNPTGNFDNWQINNPTWVAAGDMGALSFGGLSNANSKMVFNGGRLTSLKGTGPTFTAINVGWGSIDMIGTDCISITLAGTTPLALIVFGTWKSFNVFGGKLEAVGPSVGASPVNAAGVKFNGTTLIPFSPVVPTIRQQKYFSQAFASAAGGTVGQINNLMPLNFANVNKVVITGSVKCTAGVTLANAQEAQLFDWYSPSANIFNILAAGAASIGKILNFVVTEYD